MGLELPSREMIASRRCCHTISMHTLEAYGDRRASHSDFRLAYQPWLPQIFFFAAFRSLSRLRFGGSTNSTSTLSHQTGLIYGCFQRLFSPLSPAFSPSQHLIAKQCQALTRSCIHDVCPHRSRMRSVLALQYWPSSFDSSLDLWLVSDWVGTTIPSLRLSYLRLSTLRRCS
jgi:hypothetical protein